MLECAATHRQPRFSIKENELSVRTSVDLERFEAKAERILGEAQRGKGTVAQSAEEARLIADLESGKITQVEFDGAMAELTGARFSVDPDLKSNVDAALNVDASSKGVLPVRRVIEFSNTPDILRFVGVPEANIISEVQIVRKMYTDHHLSAEDIAGLPERYAKPVMVFRDEKNSYVILTDELALNDDGIEKPVMVYLRPKDERGGKHNFIASAYSRDAGKEVFYQQLLKTPGALLYLDKERAAQLVLEEATSLLIQTSSQSGSFETPESFASRKRNNDTPEGGKSQDVRWSVAPPVESEAFKKWFRDSKVVDAVGKPLVVYHGTKSDFSAFDMSLAGRNFEGREPGMFFTTNVALFSPGYDPNGNKLWLYGGANEYAMTKEVKGDNPNVMPVYISLQNPLIIEEDSDGAGIHSLFENHTGIRQDVLDEFNYGNHDGIIIRDLYGVSKGRSPEVVVVATRPEQIKSIYNAGTFDGSNPDIRFALADDPQMLAVKKNDRTRCRS